MANVYVVQDDGSTEAMNRIRCKNEDFELQVILERNPDLLPGDQINPDDPRRWLLIKREMPVPDPNTGTDRWSIDFFFADQDAIPTFVECKRFEDTRSRREIVGQMFEYAANGQYYWTKDIIRDYAEQTAKQKGISLDEAVLGLRPSDGDSASVYFEKIQENLREGQLRIVFFLEDSPLELRSVVDFLNKQMERSEILLVEARQYIHNDKKIVVPTLFGFTEEARQVKRSVTITTAGSRKKWDKTSFFDDARQKVEADYFQAIERLFARAVDLGFNITWGTGKYDGSFSIKNAAMSQASIMTVNSNGNLILNFGGIYGNEISESVKERFKELLVLKSELKIPDDYKNKFLSFQSSSWHNQVESLIEVLRDLIQEFRTKID